jgi:hypothetical protein
MTRTPYSLLDDACGEISLEQRPAAAAVVEGNEELGTVSP